MSIAENIKRIRLEHGLSQAEFGKIAGVSDKAVSTWELGTKTPRMGAVEKIANYFGITKSAIVDDVPPRLVPYSCRHTFFTLAAQSGVRKDVMQRTGGHAIGSGITDRVYIHRAAQDMAAELDKLGDKLHQMGG